LRMRGLTDHQAYISGNALVVLDSPNHVLQTTYIDEEADLEAVVLDENTGKIAVCSTRHIYIYQPYGHDYGAVKVGGTGSAQEHADARSGRSRAACPCHMKTTR
jgi:hypothetical protein